MKDILLEFNRDDFSNAKDKLLNDIAMIKSGKIMQTGEEQTRWMIAIGKCYSLL